MQICKTVTFDAAHRLDKLPPDHKCHNLHGHTYRVDIILKGEPNELGWIIDYAEIAKAWQPLHDILDHHYLNEIEGLSVPTTEVLAMWIYERLSKTIFMVSKIRVYESSTTYCEAP